MHPHTLHELSSVHQPEHGGRGEQSDGEACFGMAETPDEHHGRAAQCGGEQGRPDQAAVEDDREIHAVGMPETDALHGHLVGAQDAAPEPGPMLRDVGQHGLPDAQAEAVGARQEKVARVLVGGKHECEQRDGDSARDRRTREPERGRRAVGEQEYTEADG